MYKFDNNGRVKAQVGESPTLHFTVEFQPPLAKNVQHILKTKDGKDMAGRFFVKNNLITFSKVRKEDSGIYTLSCNNEIGIGKGNLELEIVGKL